MRKGNRGKLSRARRIMDKNTDQLSGEKSLIGLTAKVVSHVPPTMKGRLAKIEGVHGKSVDLSFFNNHEGLTVPLHALHIYTLEGQTIRFK